MKKKIRKVVGIIRLACPKFGHSALSSEYYRYAHITEFVPAVGMPRKK